MPLIDDTLFATKAKYAKQRASPDKSVLLTSSDLDVIRHRAGPMYTTESVSGRDDGLHNRKAIQRSELGAERAKAWDNTFAAQRRQRLNNLSEMEAARQRETHDLSDAWLERLAARKEMTNAHAAALARHESEHMRLLKSAKATASCVGHQAVARAHRDAQVALERTAALAEKAGYVAAYEGELQENRRVAAARLDAAREVLDFQHRQGAARDIQLKMTEQAALARERQDYERDLCTIREERARQRAEDQAKKQRTRAALDYQAQQEQAARDRAALEERAADLEGDLVHQRRAERRAIEQRKLQAIRDQKARLCEATYDTLCAERLRSEAVREAGYQKMEREALTQDRADADAAQRLAQSRKLLADCADYNLVQQATRFAHDTVERMAELEYGARLRGELQCDADRDADAERQRAYDARAQAVRNKSDLLEREVRRRQDLLAEQQGDRAAVQRDLDEIAALKAQIREYAEAEQDPAVRKAYGSVIGRMNKAEKTVSWTAEI